MLSECWVHGCSQLRSACFDRLAADKSHHEIAGACLSYGDRWSGRFTTIGVEVLLVFGEHGKSEVLHWFGATVGRVPCKDVHRQWLDITANAIYGPISTS